MAKETKEARKARLAKQLAKARKRREKNKARNARLAKKRAKQEAKQKAKQAKIDEQNKIWLAKALKAQKVAHAISLQKDKEYVQQQLAKRRKKRHGGK